MSDYTEEQRTKQWPAARIKGEIEVRDWDGGRLYGEGTQRAVTFVAPADGHGRVVAYGVDVDARGLAWAVAVPAGAVMELVAALEAGFDEHGHHGHEGDGGDGEDGGIDVEEIRWRHVIIRGGGQVGGGGKPGGGGPGGTEPLPPEALAKKARAIFAILEIPTRARKR